MVKPLATIAAFTFALAGFYQSSHAGLIVSECMSNEPGSHTTLEWVELYNNSSIPNSLGSYYLLIDSDSIAFPDTLVIDSFGYFIICRQLYADASKPGFESYWGDSSGTWGDNQFESSLPEPHQAPFGLRNSFGSVQLYDTLGTLTSELAWNSAQDDGRSWERVYPDSAVASQSIDRSRSTPGRINSVTPLLHDLSMETASVRAVRGRTRLEFMILNRGLSLESYSALYLVETSKPDTIGFIALGDIAQAESTIVWGEFDFDGMYLSMSASLTEDQRAENNRLEFTASGEEFPPFYLTEILANPTNGLTTEWIEIRNRVDQPWEINGWSLGVGNDNVRIDAPGLQLAPEERAILTGDSTSFRNFYSSIGVEIIQLQSWPALRNSADTIRLLDQSGIEADRFEYLTIFDSNHTWSRGEEFIDAFDWGRSSLAGGSPGEENSVLFSPDLGSIIIRVQPTHITPDGDGIDDAAEISITAPQADAYTLKLFDRQGRVVRVFFEEEEFVARPLIWDGTSQAGNRLPIGIYILYFEAIGVESFKTPVVIAR